MIELYEAFAAQGLAVLREPELPEGDPLVNPNLGAMALGHPHGAWGPACDHGGGGRHHPSA
ncbi:hypothetical protein [Piscinibacter sakaiensis]|uniref:hypothetical protein n=1 Tax=Piscinibacter sakaiensis TaxID=1547922 RepID=UPI003AAE4901